MSGSRVTSLSSGRAARRIALAAACCALAAASGALAEDEIRASASGSPGGEIEIRAAGSSVEIRGGERTIAEYRHIASPMKPYLKSWSTPGGINVLRDAPHDHLHHHALMFAIGTDGVDFWGEQEGAGCQMHRSLDNVRAEVSGGVRLAGFTQRLDWIAAGEDAPRLREERTLELREGKSAGASLLTWRSRLTPGPDRGDVHLDGRHYFGLGMRFVVPMDEGGEFSSAAGEEGAVVRGTEKLVRARWCAYTAKVDGRPVTVAMFDHPENARHPATWFTMTAPFAYISATLDLDREALVVKEGQTLDLCYGVALWDGRMEAEGIEALYRKWLELRRADAERAEDAKRS
ncbi:MAG: PmoA family protein [Planctomycetes bacterium]|nr:PmoA family protein [Planctomycetota bacterium]